MTSVAPQLRSTGTRLDTSLPHVLCIDIEGDNRVTPRGCVRVASPSSRIPHCTTGIIPDDEPEAPLD